MQPATNVERRRTELLAILRMPDDLAIRRMIRESEAELKRVSPQLAQELHEILALAHSRLGNYDRALHHTRIYGQHVGETYLYLHNMGAYLIAVDKNEEALEFLIRASEVEEGTPHYFLYANLAEAFAKVGHIDAARESFEHALSLMNVNAAEDHFFMACEACEAGFDLEGLELLRRAVILDKKIAVADSAVEFVRTQQDAIPPVVFRAPIARALMLAVQRVQSMTPEIARLQQVAAALPVPAIGAGDDADRAAVLAEMRPFIDRATAAAMAEEA